MIRLMLVCGVMLCGWMLCTGIPVPVSESSKSYAIYCDSGGGYQWNGDDAVIVVLFNDKLMEERENKKKIQQCFHQYKSMSKTQSL